MAKLTKKQEEQFELFNSGKRFVCIYGGASSGKTFGTTLHLIICALTVSNSTYLIVRHDLSEAIKKVYGETIKRFVLPIFFPDMKEGVHYRFRGQPHYSLEFMHNGSAILFGGAKDNNQVDKILGGRYTKIFMNEASQFTFSLYEDLISRLAEKNVLTKQLILDLNPVPKNHWTYVTFVEKKQFTTNKPLKNPDEYQHLQMNPVDNLENIDEGTLKQYENVSELKKKRFLYGEWADAGEVVIFDMDWFKRYNKPPQYNYVVQSIDTGQKDKDYNDPTAILTWGIGNNGYYLLDIINKRMDYPTLKQTVYQNALDWGADDIIIEDKASGISLLQELKASTNLPVTAFNPRNTSKVFRARAAADYMAKGLVHLPDAHPLIEDYTTQLLTFPYGDHDDMIDATTQFLLTVKNDYELHGERDIYEEQLLEDYQQIDYGRDIITGY